MGTVLVIRAGRGIGPGTVKAAFDRGHEVRAFVRSANSMAIEHPRLTRLAGDAPSTRDLAPALAGTHAVIMALGIPGNARTQTRMSRNS